MAMVDMGDTLVAAMASVVMLVWGIRAMVGGMDMVMVEGMVMMGVILLEAMVLVDMLD